MLPPKNETTRQIIFRAVVENFDRIDDLDVLTKSISKKIKTENKSFQKRIKDKPFGAILLQQVYSQETPQLITLSAHLVLEALIEHVIKVKFKNSNVLFKRHDFTYSFKVDILYSKRYLPEKLYKDLKGLGRLRNKFAHDLFFHFGEFNISTFTGCEDIYQYTGWDLPEARESINTYLLRLVCENILIDLTTRHPCLLDLNHPDYVEPGDDDDIPF